MHWTHDYFERGYGQRWSLGPPTPETESEADALRAHLRLSDGARTLDVGCGHGRLALALGRRGVQVTGLDFASALLRRAAHLARELGIEVHWLHADMRSLPVRGDAIAAALLFDAFGFFETDGENEQVLRGLARVLTPGGRLALKVANAEPILADFRASDLESRSDRTIEVSRSLLSDPPRLVEDIIIRSAGTSDRFQRRQRLYRLADLRGALRRSGLDPVLEAAAMDGTPLDPGTSRTLVIVAERRS
jgi:SAM-dependent methyltransferase